MTALARAAAGQQVDAAGDLAVRGLDRRELFELGERVDGVRARVELGTGHELGEHADPVNLLDDQADAVADGSHRGDVEQPAGCVVHGSQFELYGTDVTGEGTRQHACDRVADQDADPSGGAYRLCDAGQRDVGMVDRLEHTVGQDEVERFTRHDL